jgi:menaquinone-9 beta-reductase
MDAGADLREPKETVMSMTECLVIGGGPAGAMAAMRLVEAGREVVLLEKERAAHHKVCGEFLSSEAARYLRAAGVDPLRLGAAQLLRLRLATGEHSVETELPFRALSLSRKVLDAELMARAEDSGCVMQRGVTVERLTREGDGWRADLADGGWMRAQSVFLATGKHDLRGWKREAGIAGARSDFVGFKLHWRLRPEATDAVRDAMELFLFRGGYGGLSLVEGDAANLCLVVRRAVLSASGGWTGLLLRICARNRQLRRRLDGAQPMWERPLAVGWIPYGFLAREYDRRCHGEWRLGDQAAVIPSFTGDGMAIAMHSGALAAEMYLAGRSADEYQRRLAGQLQPGMRLACTVSGAMVNPAAQWMMRGSLPWLASVLPGAMRWIASETRIPTRALSLKEI